MKSDYRSLIEPIVTSARQAALFMSTLSSEQKNRVLEYLKNLLEKNKNVILEENAKDLIVGRNKQLSPALLDRLELNEKRIQGMIIGIDQVIALEDPVGEVLEDYAHPLGMKIRKSRVPLGVIGIIYESRPNVSIDCAILCLKSGNACVLRGGKEAFYSNKILIRLVQEALIKGGFPDTSVQLIPTTDREAMTVLLQQDSFIDCIIPRGGEGLIRYVAENSRIPVIKHYQGVCNAYIDEEVDWDMVKSVVINAKCQRPGVCNAIENILVHQSIASTMLPDLAKALQTNGVKLYGDERALSILQQQGIQCTIATDKEYLEEFLDLSLAVKVVDSLQEAVNFIHAFGSGHSDMILTNNAKTGENFLNQVDSATVYWNASTRFTDGFEFGLGAEIGISTDKIHARGPMGLRELTTYKYKLYGSGQTRPS